MRIIYLHNGKTYLLVLSGTGEWSGGHPGIADILNQAFDRFVGRCEYYPTPWHRAKHVAEVLGGRVITPEPYFEKGGKKVF